MFFWIIHTLLRIGTYSCVSIIKNQAVNSFCFGQYTIHNPTLLPINTYYYVFSL